MTRHSCGFVSKKPHKKSRGGCLTCKRKKVKCDESLPKCAYCSLRELECIYPQEHRRPTAISPCSPEAKLSDLKNEFEVDGDFSDLSLEISASLAPAVLTSIGQLTNIDLKYLHHYKTFTWRYITVRDEDIIHHLNREVVPQMGLSSPYLLYAILSIAAAHSNFLFPSSQARYISAVYRQKAFSVYNKSLQNITTDNYETLLLTSVLIQAMVPPPDLPYTDNGILTWVSQFLSMTQGLRILAGLTWSSGIEKLSVYPIFCREVRTLPPPPFTSPPELLFTKHPGLPGQDPEYPNPPATYRNTLSAYPSASDITNFPFTPQKFIPAGHQGPSWQIPTSAFLPPPLLALLRNIVGPPTTAGAPIDLHRATLLPALHALSPILLSLYHFHLSPDVYVRIIVFPSFLTPEYLYLVKIEEPRAMAIMAWFWAFLKLVPNMWYFEGLVKPVLQTISNIVMRSNNKILMDTVEGANRIVRLAEIWGAEVAARSVFEGWEGVDWEKRSWHLRIAEIGGNLLEG
ncbi:hypothetical protein CC78DRAFT_568046 [Lojkania enalia]|uniref:Zn(2)-C6 fungal-type domain-containing protein n=1 Tax=Lojkania enalia TaxID=147567 RepID=A0A9P4KE60_9PLEO|nr:hypothetical protein CC78DRAFT_568046 [Didymosphaeria enalia]